MVNEATIARQTRAATPNLSARARSRAMTAMDPEHWRRMQPLLDEALTLPPDERDDWLDRVCAGDPELRAMFDRVLRADAQTGGVLDTPRSPFPESVLDELAGGTVTEFR